jgi:FMN phosphatase YigB (HAD superfamily)
MIRAVLFDLDDTLFDHQYCASAALRVVREMHDSFGQMEVAAFEAAHSRILEAIHAEDDQVRMDWSKEEITNEPEYRLADGEEEELQYVQVYAAYGIRPYWEVESASPSTATVKPDR